MKNQIHLAVAFLLCGAALAGVPVRWTAETSRVQPIALDAWRGDTLSLECTLKSYGQPVALGAATASLMWQTNGMGSAWWQTNATVSADGVIRATWSPSMDPGAPVVAFFLPVQTADGASYRAAGTLRFRQSPGAGSQIAELPQPGGTLDFGEFNLVNAPWATLEAANEAISAAVTSATGALVIPPPVDLTPYATTGYVAAAVTSATGALVIPPPVDLTPYATTGAVSEAVQTASNALAGQIQAVSNAAMPRAEMGAYATQADVSTAIAGIQIPSLAGYATQSYVADYFATNYTPPDLSSYASRSYADAAASNAQAAAIAAIPSLAGYATESYVSDYFATNYTPPDLSSYASRSYADAAASNAQAAAIAAIPSLAGYATQSYVADYFATNYTPPDLSSYASRSYADAAASNAQATAIAAIPSLAGYATETYAQNAASSAASDALSAAQSYARDLSWGASEGNTRLVSLDGTIWQDATGTVWQVSYIYGWQGTVLNLPNTISDAIKFYPVSNGVWTAGGSTNVCWDGMSWSLELTNTITYADGSPTQSATNLTFTTSFDKYYLYYLPVAFVTNPVDRVLYASASGDAATADRALSIGTPTRWTDATGCVWEVGYRYDDDWVADSSRVTHVSWSSAGYEEYPDLWAIYFTVDGSIQASVYGSPPGPTQTNLSISASSWEHLYDGAFDFNIYRSPHATTNLVGRVALTNDLPGAIFSTISDFASTGTVHAAESSTYSSRLFDASYDSAYDATYLIRESTNAALAVMAPLATTVNSWETYWGGSNVVFEVTNYYGNTSGDLPRLRIREYKDDTWQTVWDEANKFVVCESNILRQVAALNAAVLAEADGKYLGKAWGTYTDKGSTNIVGNSVWMTSPETYFAGGTEYQRVAVGSGAICVLMDRGALLKTAGEPGTFRFQDDGGTNYFGFTKSDSYTIGCNTDGITVSGTLVTLRYDVIMAGTDVPIVYWRESLTSGSWAPLNNSDSSAADGAPYTVTWYTSGGAYYAAINCGENASGFFKAETSVMGDVVFETNMKASFLNGLVCTNTATSTMGVIRPSYNGSSVTWTWSAR